MFISRRMDKYIMVYAYNTVNLYTTKMNLKDTMLSEKNQTTVNV